MANKLRQLIKTVNAPIFGSKKDGNVNEWNNTKAEITGFTKDEVFNKPLDQEALLGTETSNYELEFQTKFGEIRYLLLNATTWRDDTKNVFGVVGVAQDVTKAAKHDGAVAAMANELRALIETDTENNVGVMCVAQDVTKAIKLWQQW